MKYRVLNKGFSLIGENDLLNKLLTDRGVENPQEFLNIDESCVHNGMLLKNMDRGLNMLKWHIGNGSRIHILADVDVDGITSMSEIYNYIKRVNPNIEITFSMNEDKIHGIKLENLKGFEFDLLIVPDAGSMDIKQCKTLHEEQDVDILILDHHEFKVDNQYAVLINCQDGQYPNNTLSGSAIVYKFMKEYDKKYGYNFADIDLDLVATGLVADSVDLRNYETRYLAIKGLKNINNEYIKEFLIKNKSEETDLNFKYIGWKIAPFINATTRIGTPQEKLDVIKAFIGMSETKEYQPRRKKKEDPKPDIETQTMQKAMIRETTNIKARQDKLVTKGMEAIVELINEQQLYDNKVIMVDATELLEKAFTGLVANKLAGIYKRPIMILKKTKDKNNEEYYGGSYRNYHLFPVVSVMELLEGVETFDFVAGHQNAGGFMLKKSRIKETQDKLNEKLKDVEIEDTYLVDYEIIASRLNEKQIIQVAKFKDVWGNTLKEPIFAITGLTLDISDIKLLGDKRNFLRIEKNIGTNKLVFTKMFASEHVYNQMIMKNSTGLASKKSTKVEMEIIGEFVINEFNGCEYPQINILDFNVKESKSFSF